MRLDGGDGGFVTFLPAGGGQMVFAQVLEVVRESRLVVRAEIRCTVVDSASGKSKIVPTVRLHDLRHTAASLLLAQGVPARVLMEMLGHSQIGITMNTYSHVMPAQLMAAADAMTTALWGDPEMVRGDDGTPTLGAT